MTSMQSLSANIGWQDNMRAEVQRASMPSYTLHLKNVCVCLRGCHPKERKGWVRALALVLTQSLQEEEGPRPLSQLCPSPARRDPLALVPYHISRLCGLPAAHAPIFAWHSFLLPAVPAYPDLCPFDAPVLCPTLAAAQKMEAMGP